jgi:hypothetical protein
MDINKARHLLPGTIVRHETGEIGTLRKLDYPADVAGWLIDWEHAGLSFYTLTSFDQIEIYVPDAETPLGETLEGD